jgi:solute carrier family 25 phosphate transporter 23/24/25/41
LKFVKHTEEKLWILFDSIDRNGDGLLEKSELQSACRRAGMLVSNRKLDDFFATVDANHDGVVTFEEWRQVMAQSSSTGADVQPRDFLLFLPANADLESVFAYYSGSTVSVNHEGDVHINHDASQSRGTLKALLAPFVASLILVAQPPSVQRRRQSRGPARSLPSSDAAPVLFMPQVTAAEPATLPPSDWSDWESVKPMLIACLPSTGYYAAGALAGIISRTATAPIDRLKVYLIAQTKSPFSGAQVVKGPAIVRPLVSAWNTTAYAVKDLWMAGGLRSLYAGRLPSIAYPC